ncbi:chromosome 1 orf 131, partial [Chelydra serpentina]
RAFFGAAGGSGEKVAPGMKRSPGGCEQQEEAARCCLLDAVLGSLYDLGEEPLVKNDKKKIQKKNVENKMGSEPSRTVMENRAACPDSAIPGKRKSASSFFEKLKNEMHHDSVDSKRGTPETSGSNAVSPESTQQGKTTEVEVVTFHGRNKKKPKVELTQDSVSKTKVAIPEKNVDGQEFNLEKARLEVHRFGITGYEKKEQRILEQERAIMLGAKPPKKEYLNYKIYQQKMKEKKTVKKEDHSMEYKADSIKKKKKKSQEQRKSKKKKSTASILPTGQVGKFTNGTLVLRGSDLKKIKSSKAVK